MDFETKITTNKTFLVLDLDKILVLCSKKPFYFNQRFLAKDTSDDDSGGEEAQGKDVLQDHPEQMRYINHHNDKNRKLILGKRHFLKFRPYLDEFIDYLDKHKDTCEVGVWSLSGSCQEEVNDLSKIVFGDYYKTLKFVYHGSMGHSKKVRDLEIVWKNNPTWIRENTYIIERDSNYNETKMNELNTILGKPTKGAKIFKNQKSHLIELEPYSEDSIFDNVLLRFLDKLKKGWCEERILGGFSISSDCFISKCQAVFENQVENVLLLEHGMGQELDKYLSLNIVGIIKDYYHIEIPITDVIRVALKSPKSPKSPSALTNSHWQMFFGRARSFLNRAVLSNFEINFGRLVKNIQFFGVLNALDVLEPEEFFVEIRSSLIS